MHIRLESGLAQLLHQTDGQQGMAAQFEKVVVPPYALDAQHLRPDGRHGDFHFALRCFISVAEQVRRVRIRQRTAVKFAVGRQWQRRQPGKGARYHVARQACAHCRCQRVDVDRGGFSEPGQQMELANQHNRVFHAVQTGQHRLDFAQLDAHATNLHLVVVTPQVIQATVAVPAHQIATAVHARLRHIAERVDNKALVGELRLVQIAPRNTLAANVKLTGNTDGHRLQVLIEYVNTGVGDGAANVQRAVGQHLTGGSDNGGFGRTIVVDHGITAVVSELPQAIAADQQGAQGRMVLALAERILGHRGGQKAHVQRLGAPPVEHGFNVLTTVLDRRHMQGCTSAQGRPDLPGHRIKTEAGQARSMTARLHIESLAVPVNQIGQGSMLHHHALGLASGAGCVNDVNQIVAAQSRYLRIVLGALAVDAVVQLDQWHCQRRQTLDQRRQGQHHHRCTVTEQIVQAFARVRRIDGHISRPRLENGQQPYQGFQTTARNDCHPIVRTYALVDQTLSKGIGLAVELRVGQVLPLKNRRHGIGTGTGLLFDASMNQLLVVCNAFSLVPGC